MDLEEASMARFQLVSSKKKSKKKGCPETFSVRPLVKRRERELRNLNNERNYLEH